jgi:hypothetical protein
MTHDERVIMIKRMEDALDAEVGEAKTPSQRIAALRAALAVDRALVWYGVELSQRNERLIEILEDHNKTLREIAKAHGAVLAELPVPTLH